MLKPVGFLQKKKQQSKHLALGSYEHVLVFAQTHTVAVTGVSSARNFSLSFSDIICNMNVKHWPVKKNLFLPLKEKKIKN